MQEIVNGNPRLRKILYTAYAIIGFVLGSVQIAYSTAEYATPLWLAVALAVFAYAGVQIGVTARSKVSALPVNDKE